jgi:hypothetical protein
MESDSLGSMACLKNLVTVLLRSKLVSRVTQSKAPIRGSPLFVSVGLYSASASYLPGVFRFFTSWLEVFSKNMQQNSESSDNFILEKDERLDLFVGSHGVPSQNFWKSSGLMGVPLEGSTCAPSQSQGLTTRLYRLHSSLSIHQTLGPESLKMPKSVCSQISYEMAWYLH